MAVSVDATADREALHRKLALGYPLLSDPELRVTDAYGVRESGKNHPGPATLVLDETHQVRFQHVGRNAPDRPTTQAVLGAIGD